MVASRMTATAMPTPSSWMNEMPDVANVAVQETLFEACRNRAQLREPVSLEGWLNRILVRSCYRDVRARQLRRIEVEFTELHPVTGSI